MNKDTAKKISIGVTRVLAFAIVFLLILELFSVKVFSGQTSSGVSKKMADAYAFTEDEPNTTDIVCLGSSDMYSGFVPITLWDEFGYTSVVSCFSHQSIDDALTLLKQIQKTQDVKLVLLEVDTMYDGKTVDEKNGKPASSWSTFFDAVNPQFFESAVERTFPTFIFHNTWKMRNAKSKRHKYSHGYLYNNKVVKNEVTDYMAYTDEVDMPVTPNVISLKNFAKYCKNEGIPLVFVEMPSSYSWNYARYNAIQQIADEVGVEYLDLNLMYDEIGISMEDCYRDKGSHLNYAAASKSTVFLGNYIKEKYPFMIDHRSNPDYANRWNEDSVNFKKINKIK